MGEIVSAISAQVAIVDLVHSESYSIRSGSEEGANDREIIDLTPLIVPGLVEVVSATEEGLGLFIDLSIELDDGEAMTAALAIQRGYSVATDDKAAIRVIAERVPVFSTLELVKLWADKHQVAAARLQDALANLRIRGSYVPGRGHPLRPWWNDILGSE